MKSVRHVVDVLRCLSPDMPELSVSATSRRLNLPKSTVSRLLATLRDGGFLEQDPATSRYRPALGAFQLGMMYKAHTTSLDVVQAAMAGLVRNTGHTGFVSVLADGDVVVLRNRPGSYPVRFVMEPGRRNPAYATAVGKALLARLPEARVRALYPRRLQRLTPGTIGTVDELLDHLRLVRERGWAEANEETFLEIRAMAVAFVEPDADSGIGLSLSYPISGVGPEDRVAMLDHLLATARDIGTRVGDPVWATAAPGSGSTAMRD